MSAPQNYWLHNDPKDFYRFTQQGLIELVEGQAGFTISYVHSLGGTREFLVDFVCKYILMKLNTGMLGKIIPATLKKTYCNPSSNTLSQIIQKHGC